mmetsp:Transcript_25274/g.69682  ORF Transcript_25274/g.69682 Transcript_25274/m.69682 type:complete len:105 (+) Transcript_25274:3499-3813(+)
MRCVGKIRYRKSENCCSMCGNPGRNAWASSEISQGFDAAVSCGNGLSGGSLTDGRTARVKNRAASHFVRGDNMKFQNLGESLEDEDIGMAHSPPTFLMMPLSQD